MKKVIFNKGGLAKMSINDFINIVSTEIAKKDSQAKTYESFRESYDIFKRQYQEYCETLISKEKKNEMIFGKPFKSTNN
ncbi:MAG: hypothetical protein LOD89_07115 [Tissierellales bacterium]